MLQEKPKLHANASDRSVCGRRDFWSRGFEKQDAAAPKTWRWVRLGMVKNVKQPAQRAVPVSSDHLLRARDFHFSDLTVPPLKAAVRPEWGSYRVVTVWA